MVLETDPDHRPPFPIHILLYYQQLTIVTVSCNGCDPAANRLNTSERPFWLTLISYNNYYQYLDFRQNAQKFFVKILAIEYIG